MFGFPFFTSLVVVLLGVVALSLIINKGLAKHSQEKTQAVLESASDSTPSSH